MVSPNSSAVIGFTLAADLQDVSALLRTAALFAKNLKTKLSVDVSGRKTFLIDPADDLHEISVNKILEPIDSQLRTVVAADTTTLVVELNFTAASFLTAGSISVRIRGRSSVEGDSEVSRHWSRQE